MLKYKHNAVNIITSENIFYIKNGGAEFCPRDLVLISYGGRWV